LEPIALRIARINEDLGELQDALEVAMRDMDSQQAEAALQLQRLRARLLDGLCPAKFRQSERVKRLAKRLARLEQNVGREQAECVRVMEAVLATVERNGAVAEAVCEHLGARRGMPRRGLHDVKDRGLGEREARAEPSWSLQPVSDGDYQGDAGVVIEEAMQAMQKMLASLERHADEAEETEMPTGVQAQRNASVEDGTGFSGGDLLDVHRVVQPSLADAEVPTEIQQKSIDDVCETSEVELTVNQGGVHKAADQPEGGADQSDFPEIPTLNLTKGSEDLIPPQDDQIEHGRAAAVPVEMVAGDRPAAIVEVRRLSSQEASSSGTSPIENLIGTQENSSEAGSSSSGEIERD